MYMDFDPRKNKSRWSGIADGRFCWTVDYHQCRLRLQVDGRARSAASRTSCEDIVGMEVEFRVNSELGRGFAVRSTIGEIYRSEWVDKSSITFRCMDWPLGEDRYRVIPGWADAGLRARYGWMAR